MGGVAASRLGLWMFDLAVMQQMQVEVISDAYHFICDLNPRGISKCIIGDITCQGWQEIYFSESGSVILHEGFNDVPSD